MDSLFSSERSRMKDISFDYSAEEASPKRNIPRVGRSFLRRGGILDERSREGGVFQRYRRFIYDVCKRSRVEAEIDNVRFRIPRFLVMMKRAIRRSVIFIFEYILHKINFLNSKMESKCFYKRV